jgi:hypothetical protein
MLDVLVDIKSEEDTKGLPDSRIRSITPYDSYAWCIG